VLVVGLVAAIVASPWLMKFVVGRSDSWQELSNVGQAYGGVSAILSGLAFCGIAGSLVLQWRQVRLGQIMTARERHFELVKLAVEDPDLAFPFQHNLSRSELRRWLVLNLWVAHWAMLWDMGALSLQGLRTEFNLLFQDREGLAWWAERGRAGWQGEVSRRRKAFVAVAEDAYQRAVCIRATAETGDGSLGRSARTCSTTATPFEDGSLATRTASMQPNGPNPGSAAVQPDAVDK
jgi:hypothetical protein